MTKTRKRIAGIVAVAALAAAVLAATAALQIGSSDASAKVIASSSSSERAGNGGGGGGRGGGTPGTHVASDPSTPLTAADADGLTFMREEEKLARDVYVLLGDKYDARSFANIARSESKHMAAVKRLMDIYSVPDPVGTDVPGSFKNPLLSELYTSLTAQGQKSYAEALRVGIAIEKRDISDLEDRIAATDRPDLKAVYGSLLRASNNHLRAFNSQLARL
jgi:hypothetical protein